MPRLFRAYDSELMEEYPEHGMYAIAYEPLWQSLRAQCKDQWSPLSSARATCARLNVYMTKDANELSIRTWRVFNLLNSVPVSMTTRDGIHAIEYAAADYILEYQEIIRKAYREMEPPSEWDWAISRHGLLALWSKNPAWVKLIYNQLIYRRRRGTPKPEKTHYLLMCSEIMQGGETDE